MSNPLLKPDDPRFRPKQIVQPDGGNPFSEGEAVLEATGEAGPRSTNTFASPTIEGGRPFIPQYEQTADHRGGLLLSLISVTFVGGLLGLFYGWLGLVLPFLSIVPAVAVIFMASEDLKMMKLGGRDPAGRTLTIIALILAVVLTLIIATMIGLLVYWGVSFFPDFFQ